MYKIIVVDDEILARNIIAEYVGKLPEFECTGSFRNGLAAVQYMNSHPVDIVLTDIKMPQMDGLELAKVIQEKFPLCVVIVISGYSEFEYARKALTYGVSNYILKPVSLKGLSETLSIEKTKLDRRIEEMLLNKDLSNEDVELFFSDLLSGKITDKKEVLCRFGELRLPFPMVGRKGSIISLTGSFPEGEGGTGRWAYGHEKFYTALLNIVRMKANGSYAYFLREWNGAIYFIIILNDNHSAYDKEGVLKGMKEILNYTPSEWKEVRNFTDISELYETPLFIETNPVRKEAYGVSSCEPEDAVIAKAKQYIKDHLSDDMTRNDVANAVFLDSAYFSRYFKKKTGQSFFDYLTAVRMQKATELLGTRLFIKDIYEKVGYHDRKYFCNIFKQHVGYSPSEYRRKVLNMINPS